MPIMSLPIVAARSLRDGGIDASAALNDALQEVLLYLPDQMHEEVKMAVGRALASVLAETVNLAVNAYPELEPSEETWISVAKARAEKRAVK